MPFTGKIEFVNCLHNTLFLFKSVFKILLLERPQSYYLFRFLAIKSLFILGFWFLFCNFIGVTEIFAHHLQTTGVTFGSACLTNITTVQNEPMVGNRYEFFRNILHQFFSTLNGVVQLSGTSPMRWLTRNTCVSTAIAALLNTTDWMTLAVFLPTPGSFTKSSRLSGT